jgi:hypothetical protein
MTSKVKVILLLLAIGVLQLIVFDINQRSGSVLGSLRKGML